MTRWISGIALALLPLAAQAQADPPPQPEPIPPRPPASERLFWGGGVGLSFGDVDYVEVSPLVGFRVSPKVDLGASLTYRWRSDDRYDTDTTDYGGTLFGRFRAWQNLFLEADWEYLNWEYVTIDFSTERTSTSSFLAGGGYYLPLGGRASMAVSALYNFSYDDNDPLEPYGDPWVVRVGIGVGF
jgi:hypothetical protein